VASVADVPPETMTQVVVDGEEICLAHAGDGNFYAIGDVCTHQYFYLSEGDLDGLEVECPQHGSRFNVVDGSVRYLPAVVPARTFPVTVEGDEVFIEL
jgi:3-phenylpropionate/trans-cinnamate dioxygenase ferredoxin subunit